LNIPIRRFGLLPQKFLIRDDAYMGFEAIFTIVVVIISLILLVWDRFPVDMVTLGTVVALLLAGILTPDEAVAGFSNPATVTVAGMLILSAAISHSGALSTLARKLAKPERKGRPVNIALPLMLVVGCISAFINNTAAVAIFLPLVLEMARRAEVAPSKLLLPLSYASLFGGVCTLLGTSTNVLVASLARQEGLAPFTIFEFLPVGLLFFVAGVLYMVLFGIPNLPDRGSPDLYQDYNMAGYLTELVVLDNSTNAGCRLDECPLTRDLEIDILEIRRDGRRLRNPGPATRLSEGDVLLVRCQVDHVIELSGVEGISLKPMVGRESPADICMVEAAIAPSSHLPTSRVRRLKRSTFAENTAARPSPYDTFQRY
jgi:di/tricarboxylate transporter